MRRGFTIIELLVASMLLGILVTILTMIFNQSSIAWRTGVAGTVDMDDVRENIAEVREEADNAFISGDKLYRLTGLWDEDGNLRNRACDAPGSTKESSSHAEYLRNKLGNVKNAKLEDVTKTFSVGTGNASAKSPKNYTVNVMSAGPDKRFDTWDDIWSNVDDLSEYY